MSVARLMTHSLVCLQNLTASVQPTGARGFSHVPERQDSSNVSRSRSLTRSSEAWKRWRGLLAWYYYNQATNEEFQAPAWVEDFVKGLSLTDIGFHLGRYSAWDFSAKSFYLQGYLQSTSRTRGWLPHLVNYVVKQM